jgi:hypothetical protein
VIAPLPDGYISIREASDRAARVWFAKEVAEKELSDGEKEALSDMRKALDTASRAMIAGCVAEVVGNKRFKPITNVQLVGLQELLRRTISKGRKVNVEKILHGVYRNLILKELSFNHYVSESWTVIAYFIACAKIEAFGLSTTRSLLTLSSEMWSADIVKTALSNDHVVFPGGLKVRAALREADLNKLLLSGGAPPVRRERK